MTRRTGKACSGALTRTSALGALCVLASVAISTPTSEAQLPRVEPSPELERLHFQLGHWETTTITLDKEGQVVGTRRGREVVVLQHGGLLIHHLAYADAPDAPAEPVMRVWQFWDRYEERLYDVMFDLVGHFETRVGQYNDGRLSFAYLQMRAFQDAVPRNWRKTFAAIRPDSYVVEWEYTEDGESWVRIYETTYKRVESP